MDENILPILLEVFGTHSLFDCGRDIDLENIKLIPAPAG